MPTNMPGALDTFAAKKVIDLEDALEAVSRIVVGPTRVNLAGEPTWDPLAANNDAAFTSARAAAGTGGTVVLPHTLKIASDHVCDHGLEGRGG